MFLAWAYLEVGNLACAADLLEQVLDRAQAECDRLTLVHALRIQALVHSRQGRWEDGAQSLAEGLALARALPYPYAEARLLRVYGQMHVQKGEPQPAQVRLEEAFVIFQRLGARKDVEQTEQLLAAFG